MNETKNIIFGLEFGARQSQICYYDRQQKEPVSIAPKVGSNQYAFPTVLSKKPGEDVWHMGLEAEFFSSQQGEILVDSLYEICLEEKSAHIDDRDIEPCQLLAVYLREVLKMSGAPKPARQLGALMVAVKELNGPMVRNFKKACRLAGLSSSQCFIQDLEESFYYYVMHQKREYYSRRVAWFTFSRREVSFASMTMNERVRPILVQIEKGKSISMPEEPREKDMAFYQLIADSLGTDAYSSIFMVGEGFEKEWAVRSVPLLCKNQRKVFYGNNLFVCGACYGAKEKAEDHSLKNYLYAGNSLVRVNVGMYMMIQGSEAYYPVIEAGVNWYEVIRDFELLLDGPKQLVFFVRPMDGETKRKYAMELPGLPERPNGTTRLHIHVEYEAPQDCVITVTDLGFGEMFPSGKKIWKEKISW